MKKKNIHVILDMYNTNSFIYNSIHYYMSVNKINSIEDIINNDALVEDFLIFIISSINTENNFLKKDIEELVSKTTFRKQI